MYFWGVFRGEAKFRGDLRGLGLKAEFTGVGKNPVLTPGLHDKRNFSPQVLADKKVILR